jgi:hypothetical protein
MPLKPDAMPEPDAVVDMRVAGLGTVLITSTNTVFAETVGAMVAASGFTPAFPKGAEVPWLSVTRTQPCVVICDYDAPVKGIKRLIAEAASRRVPLLVAYTAERQPDRADFALVERVTWLEFPVSPADFLRALRVLVPPALNRPHARRHSSKEHGITSATRRPSDRRRGDPRR